MTEVLRENKRSYERGIFYLCLTILYLSVIYIVSMFIADICSAVAIDIKSNQLTLSFIQCIVGIVSLHIPLHIERVVKIRLPNNLRCCFYVFVLCATVLGEVFSLYYRIPAWDSILHFTSGIMSGMLGGILLMEYAKKRNCQMLITPIFVMIVVVLFAISIGVIWEIYEFVGDVVLGLNMQKFMLENGTKLSGQGALMDTMKDLIVDSLGAMVAGFSAYFSLKSNKGWLSL